MTKARTRMVWLSITLLLSAIATAQKTTIVPPLVKFSGTLSPADKTASTVGVTFALYTDQTSGSPLWLETQSVAVDSQGNYSVLLGSTSKDGIPADVFLTNEARWLGVKPEGQDEQARVLLVSVPYALKAGDAETLGGKPASAFLLSEPSISTDSSSTTLSGRTVLASVTSLASSGTTNFVAKFVNSTDLGNSIIFDNGTNVGINRTNPTATLDVNGSSIFTGTSTFNGASTFRNFATLFTTNDTFGPQFAFINKATPVAASWRFGIPGSANSTSFFIYDYVSQNAPVTIEKGTGANRLYLKAGGNVGIGTATPTNRLTVIGTIESTTGGFKFPDGSTQTTAAVGTITGVTAGTGLTGGGTSGVVPVSADLTTLQARVTGTCSSGTAVGSIASNGTVSCNVISGGGGSLTLPFSGTGADSPPTVQGVFKVTDTATGPANTQQGPPDPNSVPGAVVGVATGTGITAGVIGKATGADGVPIVALSTASASDDVPVIVSWSQATSGGATLFNGIASSPDARGFDLNFAVTPASVLNATVGDSTSIIQIDGAGNIYNNGQVNANGNIHSNGDITANGSISAPTKNFKIDDPLDPANKWLYHTSIESPDMKNMYDGLVVLDQHGEAWVTMPDWFEALNRDFRYQLTAIGAPGPRLYIAREISGNRFKIAGGRKGMKVSWQVTGIRHDAWATDNRTPVEQDKVGSEIGKYYYPNTITPANSPDANASVMPVH